MQLTLATFGILLAFCMGYCFRHAKILNKAQRMLKENEKLNKETPIKEEIDWIIYEFIKWR